MNVAIHAKVDGNSDSCPKQSKSCVGSLVYDAQSDRIVMFGGYSGSGLKRD